MCLGCRQYDVFGFYTVHLSQQFVFISAVHMNCEISAFGWCWHSK